MTQREDCEGRERTEKTDERHERIEERRRRI